MAVLLEILSIKLKYTEEFECYFRSSNFSNNFPSYQQESMALLCFEWKNRIVISYRSIVTIKNSILHKEDVGEMKDEIIVL